MEDTRAVMKDVGDLLRSKGSQQFDDLYKQVERKCDTGLKP